MDEAAALQLSVSFECGTVHETGEKVGLGVYLLSGQRKSVDHPSKKHSKAEVMIEYSEKAVHTMSYFGCSDSTGGGKSGGSFFFSGIFDNICSLGGDISNPLQNACRQCGVGTPPNEKHRTIGCVNEEDDFAPGVRSRRHSELETAAGDKNSDAASWRVTVRVKYPMVSDKTPAQPVKATAADRPFAERVLQTITLQQNRSTPPGPSTGAIAALQPSVAEEELNAVGVNYIPAEEFRVWFVRGYTHFQVVDLRSSDYAGGHIRGSMNLFPIDFTENIDSVVARLQHKRTVVFHCQHSLHRGPQCAYAYQKRIAELGRMQQVLVLRGGWNRWKELYGADPALCEDLLVPMSAAEAQQRTRGAFAVGPGTEGWRRQQQFPQVSSLLKL